jgi:hypothetical protein
MTTPHPPPLPPQVRCGETFALEISALDAHQNRCNGGATGLLPLPRVELEADMPLTYNRAEWEGAWVQQVSVAGRAMGYLEAACCLQVPCRPALVTLPSPARPAHFPITACCCPWPPPCRLARRRYLPCAWQ